jgi:ribonuclease HII
MKLAGILMPTVHPEPSGLSVSEARTYLESKPRKLEDFLKALESDGRLGMLRLAERARKQRQAERSERSRMQRLLKHEKKLWEKGFSRIAGVDEVGRGPLAGPVVAAAVILPAGLVIPGLDDSKALTAEARESLFDILQSKALAIGIGSVASLEIDRINIYQATLKAMRKAIRCLDPVPERILIDGNRLPESGFSELAIIGGDAASQSIAAASVIAKVTRDREMAGWDACYPGYGFASHKGYASSEHTEALTKLGPCTIHRRSFCTVDDVLSVRSKKYKQARDTVEQIKRLSELEAYGAQIRNTRAAFSAEEVTEIDRRISMRANILQKPTQAGEEAAENWLVQSGFLILDRNLRLGRGEIDLVAQQGNTLAFVEVKTTANDPLPAEKRVSRQKQERIASAASEYVAKTETTLTPRFDLVTIKLDGDRPSIQHFPAAFEPVLQPSH